MKHEEQVLAIKKAFDMAALTEICMADEPYFKKYGSEYCEKDGKGKFAFFCKDDVSDVLAIAHLDSVMKTKDFGYARYVSGKELVMSPTLDDRLGAYVICELLPKLGVKTDILLTTDEESGNSSAKMFKTDKKYKWMFQFDRAGDDVVLYQYDTPELRKKLEEAGFRCAQGSASDISKLGDLGCSGMNFGVGYQDYHWERAWADLNVMASQVAKFMKFYKAHKSEHLVYDKTAVKASAVTHYPSSEWSGMGGHWRDEETAFGRRINGVWYQKVEWNKDRNFHLLNMDLYKRFPSTTLPTWDYILSRNDKWDNVNGKWAMAEGEDEARLFNAYSDQLVELKFPRPERVQEPHSQPSLPKASTGSASNQEVSSNSYSYAESISEGLKDDPCICGHSRYIHHRTIWKKGGIRYTDNACDWFKCACDHFEGPDEADSDGLVVWHGV